MKNYFLPLLIVCFIVLSTSFVNSNIHTVNTPEYKSEIFVANSVSVRKIKYSQLTHYQRRELKRLDSLKTRLLVIDSILVSLTLEQNTLKINKSICNANTNLNIK